MFKLRRVAFATCVLAAGVGACSVIDRPDPRHDTINRAAANARNESILLNIVRASHDIPLNFVAFSRVSGSQSASASAGLPAFGLGPAPLVASVQRQTVFGSSVLNANTNVNNSFDIGILESKDFYNGLLTPVDLATVNYFSRQGYSRQLLFWLFVEAVREKIKGKTYEYRNEPVAALSCDRDFPGRPRCFRDVLDDALRGGLTTQTETITRIMSQGRAIVTVYGRICHDEVLARRARQEYGLLPLGPFLPRCGETWVSRAPGVVPPPREGGAQGRPIPKKGGGTGSQGEGQERVIDEHVEGSPDTLTFKLGAIEYEIVTRSTFGIYRFLGGLLRNQDDMIMLRGRKDRNEPDFFPLLEINRDSSGGCFVDLPFDEHYYCVPKNGAETTKSIFSLLAQLIALRTQPGDLAITPAVRVSP
jgi:hypothetical protein